MVVREDGLFPSCKHIYIIKGVTGFDFLKYTCLLSSLLQLCGELSMSSLMMEEFYDVFVVAGVFTAGA